MMRRNDRDRDRPRSSDRGERTEFRAREVEAE